MLSWITDLLDYQSPHRMYNEYYRHLHGFIQVRNFISENNDFRRWPRHSAPHVYAVAQMCTRFGMHSRGQCLEVPNAHRSRTSCQTGALSRNPKCSRYSCLRLRNLHYTRRTTLGQMICLARAAAIPSARIDLGLCSLTMFACSSHPVHAQI